MNNNLTFYNGEIDTADNVRYQNTTILGDLTVTDGIFKQYSNANTITVYGNTHVLADGALGSSAQTGAVTYHGLITNSGTFLTGSGTNKFNGGVRNLGTFTSNDTFSIEGTGGILEGDLDDANVNVNLDAVHTFDGTDDYLAATSAKGDVQWNTTSFSATAWVYMTDSGRNIIMACTPSGTNTGWGIMVDEDDSSHLFSLSLSYPIPSLDDRSISFSTLSITSSFV